MRIALYDHLVTTAIDLFAGAGGATQGLRQAGFDVVAAVENERRAADTYRSNHPDVLLKEIDIREQDAIALRRELKMRPGSLGVLKSCPPCQGFSSLARGEIDLARNDLIFDTMRFIDAFRPRALLLENVPGLQRDVRLAEFCRTLTSSFGYRFKQFIVDAVSYEVPQRRRRLILLAVSPRVRRSLPSELLDCIPDVARQQITVRQAFADLEGRIYGNDPLNRHRRLSPIVLERISAVPVNGSRFDLPEALSLNCHKKLARKSATASYGRLRFDEPAPTMTSRCTTPACGSFVHPTLNRGITLREAATLQTFPFDYKFSGGYDSVERQIGNAVPVRMAELIGRTAQRLCG
jgi:DNA (cytosine-5)-methyltransferase 1